MSLAKSFVGSTLGFMLMFGNSTIVHAQTYFQVVKTIQNYMLISDGADHIRAWYDGEDGVSSKHCAVIMESNPDSIIFRVNTENSIAPEAMVEIYGRGANESGDLIQVTKVIQYPRSLLVNVYYERRAKPKDNGNLTLVLSKDGPGKLTSASISDGQGILNCSNLRPR